MAVPKFDYRQVFNYGSQAAFDATGKLTFKASDGTTAAGYDNQTIINRSTTETVEFSWDGTNVHGEVGPGDESVSFSNHTRTFLWVRRKSGSGGTHNVEVMCSEDTRD